MTHSKRWSKDELDSNFEEFLKISVSSGDDTEEIKKLFKAPVKKHENNALWWANDSDDDSDEKGKSKSFLKTKKSLESPSKAKAGVKNNYLKAKSISSKASNSLKVSSTKKNTQRDPVKSKNLTSSSKTRKSKNEVSMSKDSLEDISERSEEHDSLAKARAKPQLKIPINDSSIETTGAGSNDFEGAPSNMSHGNPGCDTLDELADKQHFFQNLEKEVDGTVDYSRLNQELSQTGGTSLMSPAVRLGQSQADASGMSIDPTTPARANNLESLDSSQQKPSMLSRVALMDSLESTFNTTTSPQIANSRDTTHDNLGLTLPDTLKNPGFSAQMGTNTSKEMEDLHRVLQEAGMSPTIYGLESRPPTGKVNMSSTPLHERREVDRSVGEIIREIDAIDRRGREMETSDLDIQLRSDYKSPRSPQSQGRHRYKQAEDDFDNSHIEGYKPANSVAAKERRGPEKQSEQRERRSREARPASVPVNNERVYTGRDRFSHVQSSGYGRSTSPPTNRKPRSISTGKSPPKVQGSSSPGDGVGRGQRSSPGDSGKDNSRKAERSPDSYVQKLVSQSAELDNPMVQHSLEIFAKYLTEHYAATANQVGGGEAAREEWATMPGHEREAALLGTLRDARDQLSMERTLKAKLQADMMFQEKEFQRQLELQKMKYEEEVFALKQENFVMAAKLKEIEGERDSKVKRSEGSSTQGVGENAGESREARLEVEIQEQENLLAGYQAENKRLYEEIKAIKKQAKATETSMFKENQRLTTELSNVKQELELKNTELQNKGIITSIAAQQQIAAGNAEAVMGAGRIAHLEGELTEAKRVQDNLSRELKIAQQNKFEMERHLESLLKEKESLARQLSESLTPDQVKDFETKHKEELAKLQKKIKWYAENQELLDKSNVKLRQKDDEIHRLKIRLEDFKSEAGRKLEENKIRAKEKAADAKKIQDLERQIKEMEQVIRRRHPNSLPAMMLIAANAPDVATDVGQTKGRSIQVLENRVRKLELELESKDETAQQDLRAMEQKYNQVKLQFEERVADLEQQLSLYRQSGDVITFKDHPHSHAVALERELDNVRDRCRRQVGEMQSEVDRLTAELNKVRKNQENMMRNESRPNESDLRQQVLSLQMELKDREHDIQALQHTVEKMKARSGKKMNSKTNQEAKEWPPFPYAPSTSREYKPGAFADSDMSGLLQENQALKTKIDELQLELDQQRVDLRRSLAETESVARQNRERLENQIEVLRSSHHRELQRILADQALQSSTSKTAELQSKCDTQDVMIRHLQSQLKKVTLEAEQVPHLKARETQLIQQIEDLQDKLKEARMAQAPEMRHFESLEGKLTDMVQRQRKREAELDAVVKQNQAMSQFEIQEEVEKWKNIVEAKNKQLQVFRAELDSILEVLRALQRQGVTLPVGTLFS